LLFLSKWDNNNKDYESQKDYLIMNVRNIQNKEELSKSHGQDLWQLSIWLRFVFKDPSESFCTESMQLKSAELDKKEDK
jgi:hypothetical protein